MMSRFKLNSEALTITCLVFDEKVQIVAVNQRNKRLMMTTNYCMLIKFEIDIFSNITTLLALVPLSGRDIRKLVKMNCFG